MLKFTEVRYSNPPSILFVGVILTTTSNPIHSFADDVILHCSVSYHNPRHAITNIDRDRCVTSLSLKFDLEQSSSWGSCHIQCFQNLSSPSFLETQFILPTCLLIRPSCVPQTVRLLDLSISSLLRWCFFIFDLASCIAHKVRFRSRAKRSFTLAHLLLYNAQIRPTLEYCSHLCGGLRLPRFSFLIRPSGWSRILRKHLRSHKLIVGQLLCYLFFYR